MNRTLISLVVSAAILIACSNGTDLDDANNGLGDLSSSSVLDEQFGSVQSRQLNPTATGVDQALLIAGYNEFSLDVHKALAASAPTENAIVSGYSLATALTLTMSGTAGSSREALASLLHLDTLNADAVDAAANAVDLQLQSRNNDSLEIRSANRLFVSQDAMFNTPFLDNAVANYGAPVTTADFVNDAPEVVEDINAWVSKQTNGMIPRLLETLDRDTVLAVLNAILLDAGWSYEFGDIGDREFSTGADSTIMVPYFGNQESYNAAVNDDLTAIDIPYAGNDLSMLIVMPQDLSAMEQLMTNASLSAIAEELVYQEANVSLPEWTFEQTIDAKALLTPLGLPSGSMDFSAMLSDAAINKQLAITEVVQKARIEVDKDGTRAAAATAVTVGVTSVPAQPINISINRPFWYAIRDRNTGLLLFSGRVVLPESQT